jgi:hypothetical protein
MVVYSDDFQTLNSLDKETLEISWSEASSALREKNFSNRIFSTLDYVQRIKPNRLLANLSSLTYSGAPYFKQSFAHFVTRSLSDSKIQKLALVKSRDIITRILTDSVLKGLKSQTGFEFKLFDTEDEAYDWLIAS